jgi:hypothetical protein
MAARRGRIAWKSSIIRIVSDLTTAELLSQLADAQARAGAAEARVRELDAELQRTRAWRQSTLIAVVAVALLAILMLGVVAFNAVDDQALSALTSRAQGIQGFA